MVRTKADGIKAVGAKAPRKAAISSPRGTSAGRGRRSGGGGGGGGNAYNQQPTPSWQRPVASFFSAAPRAAGDAAGASGSSASSSAEEPADRPESPQQTPAEPEETSAKENFSSNGLISDEDE